MAAYLWVCEMERGSSVTSPSRSWIFGAMVWSTQPNQMGRPSVRRQRRAEIVAAFERTLSRLGVGGASISAIADEAGVAPGLVHHHFQDREDLVLELLQRIAGPELPEPSPRGEPTEREAVARLDAWIEAALGLGAGADLVRARAWVGLLAEAIQSQRVATELRRVAGREARRLQLWMQAAGLTPDEAERRAAGLLAQVVGSLVVGALLPGQGVGFAAPFAKRGVGVDE